MKADPRWSTRGYQRLSSAQYRDGQVTTRFENGDRASVPAESLLRLDASGVNWGAMTFTPYEVVVPTADGAVEIPWSTIRALTDPSYSAYLGAAAAELPRKVGARLRELRERRQLSRDEVATRANIPLELLVRIESGDAETNFETMDTVLEAIGSSFQELALMGSGFGNRRPRSRTRANGAPEHSDTAHRSGERRPPPPAVG
jgi:transcriptional regulator with XRE-family HTH domain